MANDICDRYGFDIISTSGIIVLAIKCYGNGIITKEGTEGIRLATDSNLLASLM